MIGNFENKIIYPAEHLDKQRTARYQLYLNVGNMEDILNMTPWDFQGVLKTLSDNNRQRSGKPKFRNLRQSNKDMIKASKEMKYGNRISK